jgi:uncharacterized repeat protein (TIGR02543 family)
MKKYWLLIITLFISTFLSAQTGTPDYTWYTGKVSPYSITSTDQLLALSNIVNGTAGAIINNGIADNFSKKNITLTTNLDLSNYNYPGGASGWTSIGNKATNPFRGNFDGQNYTIKNLFSYFSTDTLVGLFGYVRNGKIGHLILEDVNIQTDTLPIITHTAGLVAYLEVASDSAIVENCAVTGSIIASRYGNNGGLIGSINSFGFAKVRNCTSSVNLLNGNSCGMIGHINTNRSVTVINCINNGSISCTNGLGSFGGGLIGQVQNYYLKQCVISNCTNAGEVSNFYSGGGLIGHIYGGPVNIDHSSNKAKIFNCQSTGGLLGYAFGSFYINTSYNTGPLYSTSGGGGIIGTTNARGIITNSYNTGNILISGEISGTGGGIVGMINSSWYDSVIVKNCYNTGSITAESYGDAGGIAGYLQSYSYGYISVKNCVSLGCSLSGYPTGCGRIVGGYEGDVTISSNYGSIFTKVNNNTVSNSITNGTGINTSQAAIASKWWNGTTGYFATTDHPTVKPDQVWIFSDNQLPVLKLISGQLSTWPICDVIIVSYNTNGGSEIADEEVSIFGKATKPVNPIRPGYTFIDWYSDQLLNNVFDFNTLITQDTTLYAKWEKIMYTVSFNTNGGSIIANEEVGMYEKALQPANPTRPGYTFVNWYSDQPLSYIFDFDSLITNNITLYAKWEIIPIVLNPEKIYVSYSCSGNSAVLKFVVKTGLPVGYKIVFDSKAITAGFENIDYIPILTADSTIIINVPSSVPAGSYAATLFIHGVAGNVSPGYAIIITKMLGEDVIVGKFTNLVFCDNSHDNFKVYQWYKNGVQIANANKQYYDDDAGRAGNSYQVRVVTSAGDTLMSCPKTFVKSQIAGVNLKLYPNPLIPGGICTLEVEGLSVNEIKGAILTIYDSHGIAIYQTKGISDSNKISLPDNEGLYICELATSSGASYSCKILLNR